ncbi:hypothetical protein [Paenibacillus sp. B2(2019)]|uniref:hypothetical protein n=1 Tax=Paenibacillus sp. B2(2019) TaxID=2607754 RepID=UPI0011F34A7E|nr:hypothetical protein [Paenibacillus sp. B2(2019)]KAA1180720.1 hypothetical protein PAENI_26080 [Paenibacillus sp. B2(2019)]
MLSDTPRKLLLIITHYSRHFGRMPSLPELERLSGRMPVDIRNGLIELTEENYIEWNLHTSPEMACIISCWERDNPSHRNPEEVIRDKTAESNTDYWLYY